MTDVIAAAGIALALFLDLPAAVSLRRRHARKRVGKRQPVRGGRPRNDPIVLREPQLVGMTDHEREAAVSALAQLLRSWLEDGRGMRPGEGRERSGGTGAR
jgi:hypothetical protein